MYRVLIAEDEPFIAQSIQRMIEQLDSRFTVCGIAPDGEEAVARAALQPDVVFTDIRMPVKDGLEVMAYYYENSPQTVLVVITGYEVFAYAQKALQFGGFDYLLKPVSLEDMALLLERLAGRLEENRRRREERYARSLLPGGNPRPERTYRLFLFQFGPFLSLPEESAEAEQRFREKTDRLCGKLAALQERGLFFFQGYTPAEQLVILEYPQQEEGRRERRIGRLWEQLKEEGCVVTLAEGPLLTDMNGLYGCYRELRKRMREGLLYGLSSCLPWEENEKENSARRKQAAETEKPLTPGDLEQLEAAARRFEKAPLWKGLQKVLEKCRKLRCTQAELETVLKQIFWTVLEKTAGKVSFTVSSVEHEVTLALEQADTYGRLEQELQELLDSLFEREGEKAGDRGKLAEEMTKYLELNYASKITAAELSRRFGLVPSYLSMVFRQARGVSPFEYLTQYRIRRAEEYLAGRKELTVREIAERTGFSDQLYFSKVFKKQTGRTPSAWRKGEEGV